MNDTRLDRQANRFYEYHIEQTMANAASKPTSNVLTLIGAAIGLGAADAWCSDGPDIVRQHQPEILLLNKGVQAHWANILRPNQYSPENRVATIETFCKNLAEQIKQIIGVGQRFAVIGGDHSCAIGTWTGARMAIPENGRLGLVWIDAHLDAHTPDTSPSGCVHGMPVASLLGFGTAELTDLFRPGPKVLPQDLCLIGARSYEQEEINLLRKLGVRFILMNEVKHYGFDAAFNEAVDIAKASTDGFGISIDLDAIHTADAPAVGTPVADGIPATQLIESIAGFNPGEKFLGCEIAEFNPRLDKDGRTARLICDLLVATVAKDSQKQCDSTTPEDSVL